MHKRILLVDDDNDDQVMFLDALGEISADLECITMNNGVEAIKSLKVLRPLPSLIFLDLNMPLMNGFECLEHLKKDEQYKKIPVVIFTTSNSPADEILAKKLGAEKFFIKTPDFKLLKSKLADILNTNFLSGSKACGYL